MLGVVAAMVVVVGLVSGPALLVESVWLAVVSALLNLAVLAPLALFAARRRPGAGRALVAAAGFLVISYVVHMLPRVGVLADLDWNWQGKTLELVWLAVLLLMLSRWAREDVGVRRHDPGSLWPALRLIVGGFLVMAGLVYLGAATGDETTMQGFGVFNVERLLFDVAHPNLVEELLWRGVLLALLDRALGTPWRLFGAKVGWGLVLTSLSFGLAHGLLFTDEGFVFSLGQILWTGFAGVLFAWVRARTGSVWLAYVGHCAPELGLAAGVAAFHLLG